MNKKNILISIISLIVLGIVLFFINKDITHFSDIFRIGRTFEATLDSKGNYVLTNVMTLKRGSYTIRVTGENQGTNNSWLVLSGNQVVASDDFPVGTNSFLIDYQVQSGTEQIQFGVYYDQDPASFNVGTIEITSDSVLYRDSLLRHLTLSLLVGFLFVWLFFRFLYPLAYRKFLGKFSEPVYERLFLFFVLLTILSSFPFFFSSLIRGDDTIFHIARIEGIKSALEAGYFPPRIYLFTLNDYGFGSGFFYPDLFLYFPALLRLLGFDFLASYEIFVVLVNFASIVSIYYATSKIAESRFAGLSASVVYALSSYRLIDVHYRGAVGETLAFIFIPFVILGLYEIFHDAPRKWYLLAIGFTGLVFSHVISTLLAGIFVAIFLLINIRKIFKDKKIGVAILKAALTTLLLTAVFWLPMIEQYLSVDLVFNNSEDSFYQEPIPFLSMFTLDTVWIDPVKPYVGYPLLLSFLLCLIPGVFRREKACQALMLLIAGYATIFIASDLFPWNYFLWLLRNIQFTWRFLTLTAPFLAMGSAILLDQAVYPKNRRILLVVLLVSSFLFAGPIFYHTLHGRQMPSYGYKLEPNRISDGKYIHVNADKEFIDKNKNTVLSSDPAFVNLAHKRNRLTFSVDFQVREETVELEIPLLYYKGYQAELTDADGNKSSLDVYPGPHGFTTVTITDVPSGNIFVAYEGTALQKAADWITLLTVLFFIGSGLSRIRLWKKRSGPLI